MILLFFFFCRVKREISHHLLGMPESWSKQCYHLCLKHCYKSKHYISLNNKQCNYSSGKITSNELAWFNNIVKGNGEKRVWDCHH